MHRVDGVKVTRLTTGDLHCCFVLGLPRGKPMTMQKSAEAILVARTRDEGLNEARRLSAGLQRRGRDRNRVEIPDTIGRVAAEPQE